MHRGGLFWAVHIVDPFKDISSATVWRVGVDLDSDYSVESAHDYFGNFVDSSDK
jgi:hypothetical protein